MEVHENQAEPWKVTLVDTGMETMTGGRVKRIQPYVGNEPFMLTYGDGVANIDLRALLDFHITNDTYCTVTAVQPPGRFGSLGFDDTGHLRSFQEKPAGDGAWINGGFFVMQPEVFNYIEDDATILERAPLENLAADGQLSAFRHSGFWQPMDTLRDKNHLEELWNKSQAPWKLWEDRQWVCP
jgi:glucose-1-phosphate cytidylyltransferase